MDAASWNAARVSNSVAENSIDSYAVSSPKLVVWFFFQIVGSHFLMPILVATFIFSKAKRDATLVNLCASFIPAGISACLLLYAGQAVGPEPSKPLCIAQAALANPCPPMWALALLAWVFHMWKSLDIDPAKREYSRGLKLSLMLLPYFVYFFIAIVTAILSSVYPQNVTREERYLYCMLRDDTFENMTVMVTTLTCAVILGLTGHLGYKLFMSWSYFRRAGTNTNSVNTQLAIRLMILVSYILIGSIFSVWSLFDAGHDTTVRDLFMATLGTSVFALFGTQRDLLLVWCFWRAPPATRLRDSGEKPRAGSPEVEVEKATGSVRSDKMATNNTV